MSDEAQPTSFTVQTRWNTDALPVPVSVNQVMLMLGPGLMNGAPANEVILTLGHVMPPLIPAFTTAEELNAFGRDLNLIAVPVGTFAFSTERLRELRDLISGVLSSIDGQA